jgi:hypothetical protein
MSELWRNGWGSWHVFNRQLDPAPPLNVNRHPHDHLVSACGRHEFYYDEPTVLTYRQWTKDNRPPKASMCRTCVLRQATPTNGGPHGA